MMIGYDADFDYMYDPQQAAPRGFCPCCGREIYEYGKELCRRCDDEEGE